MAAKKPVWLTIDGNVASGMFTLDTLLALNPGLAKSAKKFRALRVGDILHVPHATGKGVTPYRRTA